MELTESATLREPERIGPLLRDLRALGLQLAIDDFGAGWSSLSRLRLLPVQMLKIDRSFLREIPEDPEAGAIVRAVIALSDALGMTTVAEGVEQPVQQHFLAAQGCPLSQGRLFGGALPAGRDDRAAGARDERRARRGSLKRWRRRPDARSVRPTGPCVRCSWTCPPAHGRMIAARDGGGRLAPAHRARRRRRRAWWRALQRRGWGAVLYGGDGPQPVPARKALELVRLADPHLPFLAVSPFVHAGDLKAVIRGLDGAAAVVPDPAQLPRALTRALDATRLRRRVGGAHRFLLAQQAITDYVAAGLEPRELVARVLATLGETLGWSCGAVWRPSADGSELHCAATWHRGQRRGRHHRAGRGREHGAGRRPGPARARVGVPAPVVGERRQARRRTSRAPRWRAARG